MKNWNITVLVVVAAHEMLTVFEAVRKHLILETQIIPCQYHLTTEKWTEIAAFLAKL
jgi:hypothetical protein